ncbi:MAG: hypothetical protein WA908_06280 [Pontixanthobacter sp.]
MGLLLFVQPGFAPIAAAQSIVNTADARWNDAGILRSVQSNTVTLDIARTPISIETFRPLPSGETRSVVRASLCGDRPLQVLPGQTENVGSQSLRATNPSGSEALEATNTLRVGEILVFRVSAAAANRDPSAIDSVVATITNSSGDREQLVVFETGENTGQFAGAIRTRGLAPSVVQSDCELSVRTGENIDIAIAANDNAETATLITAQVSVLADPFGFVFDSEDGTPVSGARVTLIDTRTGQPATVFADDGVTPWPSTVISGSPVTDAAGNVYPMLPGEYRFPLAPLGQYRLQIEPPSPYTTPSVATREQLAQLTRPGGGSFVIADASFGGSFDLASIVPVRVDIPLDRPNVSVTITKTASRLNAVPGDAVFYTINIRNVDTTRVKRNVKVSDTPSRALRLRPDTVRIDGEEADEQTSISDDGGQLTFELDEIAPGATRMIRYAMVVRADAPPGQAINRAVATDPRGGEAVAEAVLRVERDTIASRMTIIGRVTEGTCSIIDNRIGIPGVRVMLEDGSFAITDAEGRYHFEGVVPGTHVVQVQRQTLPEGGEFVDCDRSTRTAGSAISRFAIGQGGSLVVADFYASIPGWERPVEALAIAATENTQNVEGSNEAEVGDDERATRAGDITARTAAGADIDWLALGDGPAEFLFPAVDHNPRSPAIRVAIRHEVGERVELSANGERVDPIAFDGVKTAADGQFAVSVWRGVALRETNTMLTARVVDAQGSLVSELSRPVSFVSGPWKAEILPAKSNLMADGETRPTIAVRLLDREGRPVRQGVTGAVAINAPYESAAYLDQLQSAQLTGQLGVQNAASPNWNIEGDDGIAYIELAPTMVSGPLRLEFNFADERLTRRQQIDSWIVPGDLEWTVIGLAEGSVGAKTVADNMQRNGRFDSDLGEKARVALYAKGQVLGKYLLTLAYDSAKQEDDQRILGTIDPRNYYTVYADGSDRRFDAASREKLYLRVETRTFYALYGDFVTGFDQTQLTRYNRTATGVKAEGLFGSLHAQGFAAKIATRFARDEIQGNGLTGPYRLSRRGILANTEKVAIETRDRFRSELLVERRELTRFLDYNIDILSGTISFKEPVLSRDFDLNPQIIVVDYEVDDGIGQSEWNAGARADYTFADDAIRIGATAITDKGDASRTNMGGLDLRARVGDTTEVRAEVAASRSDGQTSTGWLVEAEHRTGDIDLLAYARSLDGSYGTGQQSGAELGRRKFGVDGRYAIDDDFSIIASAWQDNSLTDSTRRRAVQISGGYRTPDTEARIGLSHFTDRLAGGETASSTVLEGGVSQKFLDNRLELSVLSSIALEDTNSIDLPARHRLRARYALTDWLRLIGNYEIANGDAIDARTFNAGAEITPWSGGRVVTTLGQQDIAENGKRTYAAFGLAQSIPVSESLTIDATLDSNRTLGSVALDRVINTAQPVASGGFLGQDGSLFEDFTAATLGASLRKDQWAATARGEYRDGEFADRMGFTGGLIRQISDGVILGSGVSWTQASTDFGSDFATETEVADAAIAAAYRPAESEFAFLSKLEYRSDRVRNAVDGEAGPTGRTALFVNGDAKSERLIASLSTNWSPRQVDDIETDDGEEIDQLVRRTEIGLFLGARYNFDRLDGLDLGSTTVLAGLDARFGIGDKIEIGASGTVRTNLDDNVTSFAVGPFIGIAPAKNTLLTVGYNIEGFRDRDFSASRNTDQGLYVTARFKFDADTFGFLGLKR